MTKRDQKKENMSRSVPHNKKHEKQEGTEACRRRIEETEIPIRKRYLQSMSKTHLGR
jgi:hypothetical protein